MQTHKQNVLSTLQDLCIQRNLHKRAFRKPTIADSLNWGEAIAARKRHEDISKKKT